jgi:hypothetical protein
MMDKAEIERATAVLIGTTLWRCLRAADMATFAFGERRTVPNFRGEMKEVGDYALHVQCAWRIASQEQVIVGSSDLYYPADYQEDEDVPATFDYEKDSNRRDRQLASLFQSGAKEFTVQNVLVGFAGSLHILLSDGLALEVFPNDSLSGEHWRLLEPGKDTHHFVVTGRGIEK